MPVSTNFKPVQYFPAGDSAVFSAKDLSVQRTRNMFVIPAPNSSTDTAGLMSFPGLRVFSEGFTGEYDRGIYRRIFDGRIWKVSASTLYSIDSNGAQTREGSISGADLVSFSDNGVDLVIVAGGTAYLHDGSTLTELSLPFIPIQIDYLNNKFIVLDEDGLIWVGDVGSTVFQPINSFTADSSPSKTTAIKVYNQFLFNFSPEDIEPWQDEGAGNPPLGRMNGAIIERVGLAGRNAIGETNNAMYFLGSDGFPYRMNNFNAERITDKNVAIAELFQTYTRESCFVQTWRHEGQNMIGYFFPAQGVTWVFSELTSMWFELDTGLSLDQYRGKTFVRLLGKTLVGDKENGNIYELDKELFRNNEEIFQRERIFRPLTGKSAGIVRGMMQMKVIQFFVESGVGQNDERPSMRVDISLDGGRSWQGEQWLELGGEGDYQELIEYYSNVKFKDLAVRVRCESDSRFSIYNASIYIKARGR